MSSAAKSDGEIALIGHIGQLDLVRFWQQALLILGASYIAVVYCFWDAVTAAVAVWRVSDTFSHGFLVVPIAIYMVCSRRHQIAAVVPAPNFWGLLILALIGIAWLLGRLASVQLVQQVAVVAMLQMLVFNVAGWPVTRLLLFPLGFLFFAVPFGEDLVRPLQDYTAVFTVKAVQLTGIPVYRDGWMIVIPSGVWEVAEACAGVRYVIPSVMLGSLFSYFTYNSWSRRLGFILVCFIGAIVANGVRAYGIVMLAHMTDNRLAVGVDHLIAGWIFFLVVIFLLFCIGLRWREPGDATAERETVTTQKPATVRSTSPKAMILTALVAVALLGLIRFTAGQLFGEPRVQTPVILLPNVAVPWQSLKGYGADWTPRFLGADVKLLQSYGEGNRKVHLFIAYYHGTQRQGAELIGGGNALFDSKEWTPISAGSIQTALGDQSVTMNRNVVRSSSRTRLVWSSYRVGRKYTANPYIAKALEIKSILLGEAQGSALIAIATDVANGDAQQAADTLKDFLAHLSLSEALASTKASGERS
jgi:exosortase A